MTTVAINGLGRIGRATLKILAGLDGVRIAGTPRIPLRRDEAMGEAADRRPLRPPP